MRTPTVKRLCMIQLYDYQRAMITALREQYRTGARAPLLVSPTGSGKTVLFSAITKATAAKGKLVTILAHRQELIEQISTALHEFSVPHGIIAPGERITGHPVQVASVFSLARRLHRYHAPDLLILDEAHHAIVGSTWGKITAAYTGARLLGVTATPIRLDGSGLGQIFDRLVCGPATADLIGMGRLSRLSVYAPPGVDTAGIHTRMGDFVRDELLAAVDKPKITGDAVLHYRKLAPGRRAVAFCVSIEHAKHVAADFMAAGFCAVSVDGTLDKSVRKGIINDFKAGTIKVLTSCDLISEGFDCPGIEVGISLRPTQSQGLWRQQVGRCLRISEGKERALILDHAGNSIRLGVPGLTPEPEWSLAGTDKATKSDRAVGVRVCPKCFSAGRSGAPTCTACGFAYPVESRKVESVVGELHELTPEQLSARFMQQRTAARDLTALIELGRMRGMRHPEQWAEHVQAAREAKQRRRMTVNE